MSQNHMNTDHPYRTWAEDEGYVDMESYSRNRSPQFNGSNVPSVQLANEDDLASDECSLMECSFSSVQDAELEDGYIMVPHEHISDRSTETGNTESTLRGNSGRDQSPVRPSRDARQPPPVPRLALTYDNLNRYPASYIPGDVAGWARDSHWSRQTTAVPSSMIVGKGSKASCVSIASTRRPTVVSPADPKAETLLHYVAYTGGWAADQPIGPHVYAQGKYHLDI